MASRQYRSNRYFPYRGQYDGGEDIDYFEAAIRSRPELQSSFDYSKLDEKFPIKSIAEKIQVERMREREEPFLEEELEYRKMQLANRAAELGIKKTARDLDLLEAQINREDAMLEQIPAARSRFAQLDPRDPEYMSKRMEVLQEFPLAFENEKFLKAVDQPLLNRHLRIKQGRVETGKEITDEQFNRAAETLRNKQLFKDATSEENPDAVAQLQIDQANRIVEQYRQQINAPQVGEAQEMEGGMMELSEEDKQAELQNAMRILSQRPELKDEINRRLISAGIQPIE
jgi:hypothetical protein